MYHITISQLGGTKKDLSGFKCFDNKQFINTRVQVSSNNRHNHESFDHEAIKRGMVEMKVDTRYIKHGN